MIIFFFSSRRRHTRYIGDWSSDVCSSDLFDRGLIRQLTTRRSIVFDDAQAIASPQKIMTFTADHLTSGLAGLCFKLRSEERRVGKECRTRCCVYAAKTSYSDLKYILRLYR